LKIVFFGDSLTWGGYGVDFVQLVAAQMPEHTFINTGVGGNTVINLLHRVDADVLALQPDAVFVMVGGNDAISYHQPKTRSYYRQAQNIPEGMVTPEQFETAYRDLLTHLQAAYLVTWVGLEPNEYNPATLAALRDYNGRVQNIARPLGIPVLDLMEALPPGDLPERPNLEIGFILTIGAREKRGWTAYDEARDKGGYTWSFDGLHLTQEGAERAAQAIVAFIRAQTA